MNSVRDCPPHSWSVVSRLEGLGRNGGAGQVGRGGWQGGEGGGGREGRRVRVYDLLCVHT